MSALFALVLTLGMTNGDYQEVVLGFYYSQEKCEAAAIEQHVSGGCYPVDEVIHSGEQPAMTE